MTDIQPRTLLGCYQCDNDFNLAIDPRVSGEAASLPAALAAHKAGWLVKDGRIYCPECAKEQRRPLSI